MNAHKWGADRWAKRAPLMDPVVLSLVGIDGNAFAIMGAFQKAARAQGRDEQDIKKVLAAARSGDYDNLLRVMIEHTIEPGFQKHHYI